MLTLIILKLYNMKKIKLSLLFLLTLFCVSMNAQKDVTKYFMTNYSFDENFHYTAGQTNDVAQEIKQIDGWTQGFNIDYTITGIYEFGFKGKFNTASVPATGYDGEAGGGLALSTGWDQDFPYTQQITLPAGSYTIKVPTYNGCGSTAGTSLLAWIPNGGSTVSSKLSGYKANAWTMDEISFTLTKTTTGKVRIGYKAGGGGSANSAKLVIDYVQLIGENMTIDKTTLSERLSEANSFYGDGTGTDADLLKAAIDEAQKVYDDATADLETVLNAELALKEAITTYRKKNASEDNPIDYTSLILNPSFETNSFANWKNVNFVTQSNNSFARKSGTYYIEKWTSQGNKIGDASVRQVIKDLPNGKYKLVVAAQNYNQASTSQKCEGAYIFAADQQTPVYTPNDYSVTFTSIAGEVEIGFVAEGATGNWLAVDNFRLYLIGYVDINTVMEELNRLITKAEGLAADKTMSAEASAAIATATAKAKEITTESAEADIQAATKNLIAAIETAEASIARYDLLTSLINSATSLTTEYMQTETLTTLQNSINAAMLIDGKSTNSEVETAIKNIETATEDAKSCISAYTALKNEIDKAGKLYDESKNGADVFSVEITKATEAYNNKTISTEEAAATTEALKNAELAFNLANATEGTGNAPRVTKTNHYVLTGATEALMRADFSGSNILERGVCWSTEHNPTVLDGRTTLNYNVNGYIYHIKGLEPATVYYLRPYVMNKTYTVAYGDEVKIVTHPMGTCTWSWNEGAPTEAANTRCRNAVKETIDYFNEWTGIKGFKLTGNYGSGTPTADCSYGGWMRIGPNAAYQAIGTVLHETGHGVGVGTHWRWYDCSDTRANKTHGKWLGREANKILDFLENDYTEAKYLTGDGVHGWGQSATFDWFVNGADKDKHTAIQYIGGCCLLYGLFIDGLCPTSSDPNGIAGYTYNFDDSTKYYIMNKEFGLGEGLLYARRSNSVGWYPMLATNEEISDSAAWYLEFNAKTGMYMFRNAETGKYLNHTSSNIGLKEIAEGKKPGSGESFQLMPDRTNVTIGTTDTEITTHGFWFTWNDGSNRSMTASKFGTYTGYGKVAPAGFDFSDKATAQQWIIISEKELDAYKKAAIATGIGSISVNDNKPNSTATVKNIYSVDGTQLQSIQPGINIIRYSDGTIRKVYAK